MIYFHRSGKQSPVAGYCRIRKRGQKKAKLNPELWYIANLDTPREPKLVRITCWSKWHAKILIKGFLKRRTYVPIKGSKAIKLNIPLIKGAFPVYITPTRLYKISKRFPDPRTKQLKAIKPLLETPDRFMFYIKDPTKNLYYVQVNFYSKLFIQDLKRLYNKEFLYENVKRIKNNRISPFKRFIVIENRGLATYRQTLLKLRICQKNFKLQNQ